MTDERDKPATKADISALAAELARVAADNTAVKAAVSTLRADMPEVKAGVAMLRSAMPEAGADIIRLHQKIDRLAETLAGVQADMRHFLRTRGSEK